MNQPTPQQKYDKLFKTTKKELDILFKFFNAQFMASVGTQMSLTILNEITRQETKKEITAKEKQVIMDATSVLLFGLPVLFTDFIIEHYPRLSELKNSNKKKKTAR